MCGAPRMAPGAGREIHHHLVDTVRCRRAGGLPSGFLKTQSKRTAGPKPAIALHI